MLLFRGFDIIASAFIWLPLQIVEMHCSKIPDQVVKFRLVIWTMKIEIRILLWLCKWWKIRDINIPTENIIRKLTKCCISMKLDSMEDEELLLFDIEIVSNKSRISETEYIYDYMLVTYKKNSWTVWWVWHRTRTRRIPTVVLFVLIKFIILFIFIFILNICGDIYILWKSTHKFMFLTASVYHDKNWLI